MYQDESFFDDDSITAMNTLANQRTLPSQYFSQSPAIHVTSRSRQENVFERESPSYFSTSSLAATVPANPSQVHETWSPLDSNSNTRSRYFPPSGSHNNGHFEPQFDSIYHQTQSTQQPQKSYFPSPRSNEIPKVTREHTTMSYPPSRLSQLRFERAEDIDSCPTSTLAIRQGSGQAMEAAEVEDFDIEIDDQVEGVKDIGNQKVSNVAESTDTDRILTTSLSRESPSTLNIASQSPKYFNSLDNHPNETEFDFENSIDIDTPQQKQIQNEPCHSRSNEEPQSSLIITKHPKDQESPSRKVNIETTAAPRNPPHTTSSASTTLTRPLSQNTSRKSTASSAIGGQLPVAHGSKHGAKLGTFSTAARFIVPPPSASTARHGPRERSSLHLHSHNHTSLHASQRQGASISLGIRENKPNYSSEEETRAKIRTLTSMKNVPRVRALEDEVIKVPSTALVLAKLEEISLSIQEKEKRESGADNQDMVLRSDAERLLREQQTELDR